MESKYKRYNDDIIDQIGKNIGNSIITSASECARSIGIDVSGLIKHIKKYRTLKETSERNKCGKKISCGMKNSACTKCHYLAVYRQEKSCAGCKNNCNLVCKFFTKIPSCSHLKKFPYTCDRCNKKLTCHLNKFYYEPDVVVKLIKVNRSDSRKGIKIKDNEFIRLSNLLVPLIKHKHQSLPQIFHTHKVEIKHSYPSILKYIDAGLIPNLKNIDLTKRVRYPKTYKKKDSEPTNAAFLTGRTYDDFIVFITEHVSTEVVEMDTVLSSKEYDACLLTFLFRKSNFMLAFKLNKKTTEEVKRVFEWIKSQLGIELYRQMFSCILTDNGTEFADPRSIEFDLEKNEKIVNLFYCDPGKSGQKGKIEKNHVELRKIFPKPTNFSTYSQEDINLALSHINSEPRGILNGNCPGKIASVFISEKIFRLIDFKLIEPDEVVLHPNLFKLK